MRNDIKTLPIGAKCPNCRTKQKYEDVTLHKSGCMYKSQSQHTPTSLIDLYDGADRPVTAEFLASRLVSALGVSMQKANDIVRAVNAHEYLLECLQMVHDRMYEAQSLIEKAALYNFVKAAIAKAEGK